MPYKKRLTKLLNHANDIDTFDPDNSLEKVFELYSELEGSNDYNSIGKLCKLIGTVYLQSGQFTKASDYYNQAISNFKLDKSYGEIGNVYNNLVIVAYYLETYEKIEEYSQLALDNFELAGDSEGIISVANNLAKYYRNISAFDKAYPLLKKTIKDYESSMDEETKAVMLANYANVCINIGLIDEGFKLLLELSETVSKTTNNSNIALVNRYLSEYYEAIGDYKNALACHKKRFNSTVVGQREEINSKLDRYLNTYNIDIDRLQYDRMVKQNEELISAHNAVSKQNGFLETLIDTIPLPLFYCDSEKNYLGVNDAFADFFNIKKNDVIGKKVGFSIYDKYEIDYITNKVAQLKDQKSPLQFISKLTKENGDSSTLEFFFNLFYEDNGELAGLLGMFKDITQEIEQNREVVEVNAHLKSILESASQVFICSINREYKYRYFNKNYAESIKRHIGKTISKGSSYFDRYQTGNEIIEKEKLLDRVFSGEVVSGIREYNDLQSPEILQYYYSPIIEEGGDIIGATVFSYDITERVLAQRELALSNKTKDKFFSIIAHDLRSPIGNIKSALEFITTEEELSKEEVMELLEKLSGSAMNTYDLLENLLQWSITQRGIIDNKARSEWLADLIEDTIKLSRNIAHNKAIEIEVICQQSLQAFVDKNLFFTILRNLLNNAIKYSYSNSIIKVTAEEDDKYILIKVIDQGVGIKPEIIPYLNQLDKTVTTYGTAGEIGSGLGLVLCQELISKLGGSLKVESVEGKGSIFSFTVPAKEIY